MHLPIENLTPRQIVAELDAYIVGQDAAKRAVAVALRNRYRRQQLPEFERDDVMPKNILMIGPTGVGKTEIARRLAQLARAPFVKVEATKFTEVGYVGRDVDAMVRDLVAAAVRLVEKERMELALPMAKDAVTDRLVDLLDHDDSPAVGWLGSFGGEEAAETDWEEVERKRVERRSKLRERLEAGEMEEEFVEFDVEEASSPFVQVFSPQGVEEMGIDMAGGSPFGNRRSSRRLPVREARSVLIEEEARKLVDKTSLHRDAVERTEQTGIIFIDEIDKVAIKSTGGSGPDVSREGVQRDLLPIIEGSTVQTKFGPVRTDHILFIAAGAFNLSKPSDLIPELQGRLPIRVELTALSENDFRRILREPKNALTRQYALLLAVDGYEVEFTDDALNAMAHFATEVNQKTENIGARRLHTILERLLEDELFAAPDGGPKRLHIDKDAVHLKLEKLVADIAAAKNIL